MIKKAELVPLFLIEREILPCCYSTVKEVHILISPKAARVNAGYSLKQVAKLIGVSQSTVSRWEHGEVKMKPEVVERLSQLYNMDQNMINFRRKEKEKSYDE